MYLSLLLYNRKGFDLLAECPLKKERYKHLNAEFQRIARRDKKAFLSEQYKETGKQ